MIYYLDTDTLVSVLRGAEKPAMMIDSFPADDIKIPSIVKAELMYGAYKSKDVQRTMKGMLSLIEPYDIALFDDRAFDIYGRVRAELEKEGRTIGSNDLLIAATVMSRNGILVTNNIKEFERIKGLRLENWM